MQKVHPKAQNKSPEPENLSQKPGARPKPTALKAKAKVGHIERGAAVGVKGLGIRALGLRGLNPEPWKALTVSPCTNWTLAGS